MTHQRPYSGGAVRNKKTNWPMRLSVWLEILAISGQCAILFLLLLLSLVFTPTFISRTAHPGPDSITEVMNFNTGVPSIAFLGGLLVFLALLLVISSLLTRIPQHGALLFLLAFVTIVQFGWIFALSLTDYQYPDSASLMDAAASVLQNHPEKFDPTYCTPDNMPDGCTALPAPYAYFSWYPFQSGPLFWFIGVFAIFGIGNITAFQIINALMITALTAILWRFGTFMGLTRQGHAAFTALCCTCMPLLMYCAFVYTNIVGLCFMLAGALLVAKSLSARNTLTSALLLTAAFVVFGLGILFKTTYIIVLLAAIIAIILATLRSGARYWQILVSLPLAWLAKTISGLPIRFLESWSGQSFSKTMPMLSWIAIGLNQPKGGVPGWWGPDAVNIWTASNGDYQVQLDAARNTIHSTLSGFAVSPLSGLKFFQAKLTSEWSEPTFMTSLYSQMGHSTHNFSGISGMVLNPRGGLAMSYQNVAMSGLYLFAFIGVLAMIHGLVTGRHTVCDAATVYARSLLSIAFLGGFLCYVVWEAKGIYTLPFYLMLIPISAYGIQTMLTGIIHLREKSAQRTKHAAWPSLGRTRGSHRAA
ncbi:glycosyltransferase family 39 protein [Bifidobacterium callitrichidarum]|uniref:Glycosyltransferase RgtA/B/C/D-like domain-containing protein n=1 Tax=Bifidobacterium callitrichidarum TaxID=2052941 RepID=A0A2U2NA59_9BIFI|nr:glycosyltransferase family 39 protein [Bifidobacterium callitrichidarum]PWG65914.1 hypothetical protein DF196_06100 [Bifidobacterium callitrichidarum]